MFHRAPVALHVVLLLTLGATLVASQPSIEATGKDINVNIDTARGAVFSVNGQPVGLSQDITNAITSLRNDITSDIDQVSASVDALAKNTATKVQLQSVKDTSATKADVKTSMEALSLSLASLNSSSATNTMLDTLNQSVFGGFVQMKEVTDGLEQQLKPVFGWRGAIPFGNCTVQNCTLAIHGKGFFPSTTTLNGVIADTGGAYTYTVKVTPKNTFKSFKCPILSVTQNFIFCQCGGLMTDPPSAKFFTNLEITEKTSTVPYGGDETSAPVDVVEFTTEKATIHTENRIYSYTTSLSPSKKSDPIEVNFTSHGSTTPTFASADQSIVADSGIVYTKSSTRDGGSFTVQFLTEGSVDITITVLDTLDQPSTHVIAVVLAQEYTCNSPTEFKASKCVQNPIDPHWGRGSNDCMKLQDDNLLWNVPNAAHIGLGDANGYAELTWPERTLYAAKLFQRIPRTVNGYNVYLQDGEQDSPTYGDWVLLKECTNVGDCPINAADGSSTWQIPLKRRRTTGFKLQRTAPLSKYDTIRVKELDFVGCD